jgi:DNA damage-inducible protein 1
MARCPPSMHLSSQLNNLLAFGRVTMLYIDVLVNNVPIKAFVDSGAQTTIMSPSAAERCGINRLVDQRFGGIAKGVGTANILGRVHSAEIQIGQYNLDSSYTVMEGKDVDLLLGLDNLKRHQMCIDLRQNCLIVQNDKIPFLPESEIPKMFDEILENEPKIEGPEGTQFGARTGTVEQPDQPATATGSEQAPTNGDGTGKRKINIHPAGSKNNIHTNQNASSSSTSATNSQPPPNSTFGFGQPQRITKESIDKITDLGFTREEAVQALQQVNGDVELAVGLLL